MKSRYTATLGAAAAFALLLTGCDGDTEAAVEQDTETVEAAEAQPAAEVDTDEGEPAEAEESGSRDNPLPLGETFEYDDWSVTVNSFNADATAEVLAENMFNEEPAEGTTYALINASVTYLGDDSEMPALGTDISFVTSTGETVSAWESMTVAPDALDSTKELYTGGTVTGNVVVQIPADDAGTIRVRLGLFDTEDAFFGLQ